jgi:hypothetical protein
MTAFRDRRRGTRYAGVLRDNRTRTNDDRPAVEHSEPRSTAVNWRLLSGAIVVCLSVILVMFFTADAFYVRSVAVGGLKYLTKEEVFALTNIANVHIFWINPGDVREKLMESPSIADARVTLGWPPNMVNIVVEEREPVLVWEQGDTAIWVDLQGRIMVQREDRPELIRIATQGAVDQGKDTGHVDEEIVFGALQLQELMPDTPLLLYDANKGLGFRNTYGWDVWMGVGTGMPEKYQIYQTLAAGLVARGIQAGEVNITNPDAPYYNVLWGREAPQQ